jgi:hypothetical protein
LQMVRRAHDNKNALRATSCLKICWLVGWLVGWLDGTLALVHSKNSFSILEHVSSYVCSISRKTKTSNSNTCFRYQNPVVSSLHPETGLDVPHFGAQGVLFRSQDWALGLI